jgi:hypothetical protein
LELLEVDLDAADEDVNEDDDVAVLVVDEEDKSFCFLV